MKKIVGAISCVLLLMVVLVCATACKKEPDPIVSVPDKIIEFNNNLHNNWSKTRPVTVKNEIVIKSDENNVLVKYIKQYTLTKDNVGKLSVDTIYFDDIECPLNNKQEMYFKDNKMHMKYTDTKGESITTYPTEFSVFMELITEGTNNIFDYNYIYKYFKNVEIHDFMAYKTYSFEVLDEHLNEFLGTTNLGISNMKFSYQIFKKENKMNVEFEYDSSQEEKKSHIVAKSEIIEQGEVTLPDWALKGEV